MIKVVYTGDLRTEARDQSGSLVATDAPVDNHGKGEHFSPTDLFALSLASCMLTLMGIGAKKLGLDLKGASAEVMKEMVAAPSRRIGKLSLRFRCPTNPPEEARATLEKMALTCPVHASLHPDIRLEIDFVWGL